MDVPLNPKNRSHQRIDRRGIFLLSFVAPLICVGFYPALAASAVNPKHVYGRIEYVNINGNHQLIKAKLDTGAKLSSLSATNITPYEKNGTTWLAFNVYHKRKNIDIHLDRPLIKYARIKQRHDEDGNNKYSERPVVSLTVCLRHRAYDIEVNLVDRANFIYPMLLGANAIEKFEGLVDPGATFTARPDCVAEAEPAK